MTFAPTSRFHIYLLCLGFQPGEGPSKWLWNLSFHLYCLPGGDGMAMVMTAAVISSPCQHSSTLALRPAPSLPPGRGESNQDPSFCGSRFKWWWITWEHCRPLTPATVTLCILTFSLSLLDNENIVMIICLIRANHLCRMLIRQWLAPF